MPRNERPNRPTRERRPPSNLPASVSTWADLTEILGPPPLGEPGTSVNPAGGVYGESNPNSRSNARADELAFEAAMGRRPTATEKRMIEQRWLGWGYR